MVAQHYDKMIQTTIVIFYKIADLFFKGIIGYTILDGLLFITNMPGLELMSKWLQSVFAFLGIVYFLASWPHKKKMQRLEQEKIQEEIEKLKNENHGRS